MDVFVKRRIIRFETDEHGDWRAALDCGHFQHVRHDPPLTTRLWVLTEAGRNSRIGFELDCKRCDEAALAETQQPFHNSHPSSQLDQRGYTLNKPIQQRDGRRTE